MLKRKVALFLLAEEEEEEELLIIHQSRQIEANVFRKRKEQGFFNILISQHLKDDESRFRQFFRVNSEQFDYITSLVKDDLRKFGYNRVLNPISPEEKVALTLRFLASGESFKSLSFAFRISSSYISKIVKETLTSLSEKLVPIFLPEPTTETLTRCASEFRDRWNFPNCVAAVDGKHVRIFSPKNSGSLFYNYKDYFSIVLLALVDANCKFIAVEVGSYGKEGDSTVMNKSEFGRKLQSSDFFPPDAALPGSNVILPYVIVGDEAFRLQKHPMKPFNRASAREDKEKATFNYRLSRARRVSENSFALLSQVWRVYYSHIQVQPETVDKLILVTCCLHNMLRDSYLEANGTPYYQLQSDQVPDQPTTFSNFNRTGGFQQLEGFSIREEFTRYFNNEGMVEWQEAQMYN